MDRLDRAIALLGELIAFPTVSSDSNLDLIAWAADLLHAQGAEVSITHEDSGIKANLFATFGPQTDGGVILSGHTDVVPVEGQPWRTDPFAMTARDGRLYGRGACDMKGFVACVLALAPEFAAWPLARPVHVALTHDEEVGCLGAQALTRALGAGPMRPAMAIIGEPTEMRIVTGHKGCFEYTTEFHGREGHGSAPDLGVNAADVAARYVARLAEIARDLRNRAPGDSPFSPPCTTINVGRVAAGSARNVIAGHAEVEWEMRPVAARDAAQALADIDRFAADTLLPDMRAVCPDARIERHVIAEVAGLVPAPDNRAVALATALTGGNATELVAFGTEAGLFQQIGVDSVVCGPGAIEQAHKPDEFIETAQLAACLRMLSGLRPHLV